MSNLKPTEREIHTHTHTVPCMKRSVPPSCRLLWLIKGLRVKDCTRLVHDQLDTTPTQHLLQLKSAPAHRGWSTPPSPPHPFTVFFGGGTFIKSVLFGQSFTHQFRLNYKDQTFRKKHNYSYSRVCWCVCEQ